MNPHSSPAVSCTQEPEPTDRTVHSGITLGCSGSQLLLSAWIRKKGVDLGPLGLHRPQVVTDSAASEQRTPWNTKFCF